MESYCIALSDRGQLYVAISFWWIYLESPRSLALPTPPIFDYNFSVMHFTAHVDANTRKLDSFGIFPLVLFVFLDVCPHAFFRWICS